MDQMLLGSFITSHLPEATTQLLYEGLRLWPKNSTGLNGHWREHMGGEWLEYFVFFRLSAAAATIPGPRAASSTYEGAKVSEHVASQTSNFPRFHGTNVIPSGCFPSTRLTPMGSNRDGMCAVVRALCTISFSTECL